MRCVVSRLYIQDAGLYNIPYPGRDGHTDGYAEFSFFIYEINVLVYVRYFTYLSSI